MSKYLTMNPLCSRHSKTAESAEDLLFTPYSLSQIAAVSVCPQIGSQCARTS